MLDTGFLNTVMEGNQWVTVSLSIIKQGFKKSFTVSFNALALHLFTPLLSILFLKFILIGRLLLYNVVLLSAIHQHESAIGIHTSPPSQMYHPSPTPSHPFRLSQSIRLSSLCHTTNPHWLSLTQSSVYVSVPLSVPPSLSPAVSTGLFPLSASLLLPYI